MFHKVLIANRGEIALRIIRACKELGIETVAVHSTADEDAIHTKLADESICIGPPNPLDSYLNISAILSAAEVADADAIHPGYGFLAENAEFAEICENCGINFIGPSSKVIRLMGNKILARKKMKEAGVVLLPGSEGGVKDEHEAVEIAKKIGFPVILKAAAGGGGKGLKVVYSAAALPQAFHIAKVESTQAFGDDAMFIEKFSESPRHIEFQIMADKHGNIIHLGERECSIQRRHQKLLEESPSVALDSDLRKKMSEAAVRAAKVANYNSVGTVEFLLEKSGKFYFLEMNTRVQVEHPVTEMVSGVDIVKEQIRIAAGEKLALKQKKVKLEGHSIECRVNAEDPKTFMPSAGKVKGLHFPGGVNVRVDSALFHDCDIPPFYDSLIAKVIVHGNDRQEAINRMLRALDEFIIDGVSTTIPFHQKILKDPDFVAGKIDLNFLKRFE